MSVVECIYICYCLTNSGIAIESHHSFRFLAVDPIELSINVKLPVHYLLSHLGQEGLDFLSGPSQNSCKSCEGVRLQALNHADLMVAA